MEVVPACDERDVAFVEEGGDHNIFSKWVCSTVLLGVQVKAI